MLAPSFSRQLAFLPCRFILVVVAMISAKNEISCCSAFHDCVQTGKWHRMRRSKVLRELRASSHFATTTSGTTSATHSRTTPSCTGGLCVGMTNGPHQWGNSSYSVAWNGTTGTTVHSRMTVPALPQQIDGITYYLWTDVFFGDASLGRMNQLVPQLILGSALDSSSGPPFYHPYWHNHVTWTFGAHYFFETQEPSQSNESQPAAVPRAVYGPLHPTSSGEVLYTTFDLLPGGDNGSDYRNPKWVLTMGVVGDDTRISRLDIERPYMGIGENWDEPTKSWMEHSYQNLCINACWELYGATDDAHIPSSGSHYSLTITQPEENTSNNGKYAFTTWEQDEGNGLCPSCTVRENHVQNIQTVNIDISVAPPRTQNSISFTTRELKTNKHEHVENTG